MDRTTLRRAAALLAKAQDTNFDAEAAALAEKAYRLLAEYLNAHEGGTDSSGAPRRRERRYLWDRRARRRAVSWGEPTGPTDPAASYRRSSEGTTAAGEGDIDLKA